MRISGLPYGNYMLNIRGQSTDGQFSSNILSIPIHAIYPLYLRWWFLATLAFTLSSLGIFLYKWRTRRFKHRQKELEKAIEVATENLERDKKTIERQAEELRNLDKIKSRFFANVSHELRTPLTLLLAPIQNVLKNNKLNNKDYTSLLLAKNNAYRLNKMVNEILALTKMEAGKIELQYSRVVWYVFLKQIIANFESFANQKNIQFLFHYEERKDLQVQIDKEKVEIILMNLLSNAFKFTPQNGTIQLRIKSEGQYLWCAVIDTGRGIHPEDLPFVFDRFYQSKRKNAPVEGGTGIGLALTREFVHLMDGQIEVKSKLGQGAEFFVKIPKVEIISQITTEDARLLEGIDQPPAQELLPEPKSINTTPTLDSLELSAKILLVEDNYDLRHFIKELLEPKYTVVEAVNGKAALELLDQSKTTNDQYGLIISDIMMPILDGYQLVNALKADLDRREIPIIMLTARGGIDDKLKALRIGVDDYLTKPFEEEELLVRIDNLLQHRHWRQQHQEASQEQDLVEKEVKPERTVEEKHWLERLESIALEKLKNNTLSVEQLAYDLATNRWTLNRRIKTLTGLSSSQYLQELRLNRARHLLEQQQCSSIKALAYEMGFKDTKYFSRQFKKRFGKLPSSYF
ncbi:MAG: ATP-binding protein [Bacteroidota bacterium]